MNEPLTEKKIVHCGSFHHVRFVELVGALKRFEDSLMKTKMAIYEVGKKQPEMRIETVLLNIDLIFTDLKDAFPVVYEKEDLRTTIVDPFPRRPKQ